MNDEIYAANIKTSPYPGFPTDLQAQIMTLMTISNGNQKLKKIFSKIDLCMYKNL